MGIRLLIVLVGATLSGCLGEYALVPEEDAGGMMADGGGGGGGPVDPTAEFNTKVKPILSGSCGACHNKSGGVGPGFLEEKPDMLTMLLAYPALVGDSPQSSRLYTKGVHDGPALNSSEAPVVASWIINWNLYGPKKDPGMMMGPPKPIVKPFVPVVGANVVELSALDPKFAGMQVTFDATVSGTNLTLTKLNVKAAAMMGVRIAHPLFVTWDPQYNATPDPIDSFSNLDQTVFQGETKPMGPGILVLPNFQTGYLLNIVFKTIETKEGMGGGGTITGCKAVANFAQNVRPLINGATPGCQAGNCHGGGAAGLTMAAGLTDADYCLNVRNELDFTTPANSRILTKPNPASGVGHQGGKMAAAAFATFQTAVNNWLNAER